MFCFSLCFFFFFNDTATTEIYTLSLHDALPISRRWSQCRFSGWASGLWGRALCPGGRRTSSCPARSEEHTSELQSRRDLVCRLLLEKKKKNRNETLKRTNKPANQSPVLLYIHAH